MFGLVAMANTSVTASAENALTAVADPDVTVQNSQFVFTGRYNLMADLAVGASVKFGRYNVAQWNGRGRPNIFAVNRNANPTSPVFWGRYLRPPLPLPQNQQIQALLTNNLSMGNEAEFLLWKICTPDWSLNEPAGQYDLVAQATVTVTPAVGTWVNDSAITFDQLPLGGVYAVLGAYCEGANSVAFRLNFKRTRLYEGRRLRPGGVVLPQFGSLPPLFSHDEFGQSGVWGYFHTFELPTFDVLGTTASSTAFTIFMKLRFISEDISALSSATMGNY